MRFCVFLLFMKIFFPPKIGFFLTLTLNLRKFWFNISSKSGSVLNPIYDLHRKKSTRIKQQNLMFYWDIIQNIREFFSGTPCMPKNVLGQKKILSKNFVSPKFLFQKVFGKKKIFSKKIWVEKFLVKIKLDPKIWVEKIFGSKKLGSKHSGFK